LNSKEYKKQNNNNGTCPRAREFVEF